MRLVILFLIHLKHIKKMDLKRTLMVHTIKMSVHIVTCNIRLERREIHMTIKLF